MLRKEMFPRLRPKKTFVAEAKLFLNLFRNILLPQQMFPPLHISGNKVSATMFLRLRAPLDRLLTAAPLMADPTNI